jgi:hypothetical protein
MFKRKFILILIILLIIFVGISVNQWWQEKEGLIKQSEDNEVSQKENWKTYRNEEWGFEFRYPDNWEIRVNTFKSPFSKFNLVAHPINTHPNFEPFGINITDADYVERSYQSIESKATSTTVDGVIATKYEYVTEAYNIDVIVPIGGTRILIGNENKEHLPEFNQILTSFKFLK